MYGKILFSLLFLCQWGFMYNERLLGGIMYSDSPDIEDLKLALSISGNIYNFNVQVKEISKTGEVLEIIEHVCDLAKLGVYGIIDTTGGRSSAIIQSVCDVLELPHVMLRHNEISDNNWSVVNLFPSSEAFNNVVESLVKFKNWDNFTILHNKGSIINQVHDLLKIDNDTDQSTVSVRELSGNDYRDVLINAKDNGFYNFVVDCPSENIETVLEHAYQVGLMTEQHSFIFLSPDLFTLNLDDFRYCGVNMTGFRLVDLKRDENLWNYTDQFNNNLILPENLKNVFILIHDAMKVFDTALEKIPDITAESLSCINYESWEFGSSLMNFMKTNKVSGLTRQITFDGNGDRTDVQFEILELTPSGNQTIGTWKNNELEITRPPVADTEMLDTSIMKNKTFKVLISLTPPYGFVKESLVELEGNDQFEGFTIDLIEMISQKLGFYYEFEVEKDYGSLDPKTKTWNGMILKIMEDKADFCICDFTMTAERQKAVDFSTPFMTLGLSILYKEPSKQPPETFSFMSVFSKEVWYYMVFVQLGVGVIMIFIGRISKKEWQNPVPCIEQPEELSNQFSFANSIWLIIGSIMQQGSEIAPIAIAPRMVTSFFWFFTMVMVASYTGTLVAFLTVENNVYPFQTAEELYRHKTILYGAKGQGSTISFFKDSTNDIYREMYEIMRDKKGLLKDNDVAVERAETTNFAAFMESTTIEFYKERHCDLIQVGGLLDSKAYGIGMKKGSIYKRYIDDIILQLKESGDIQKLKDRWWKEKRGGGKCGEKKVTEEKQLGMKNLIGAFIILSGGCLLGLFVSIFDMLWGVFKRSVKYETTFKNELIQELKFFIQISEDIKPVTRPSKSDDSSIEALAEAEGKDEVKSLHSIPSIRSGKSARSSDTHRTHHSHSSRHSSGGLSVAFARRREYT